MVAMSLQYSDWRLADDGAMLAQLEVQPVLRQMIIDAQKNDEELQKKLLMVRDGDKTKFLEKKREVCISRINYVCQMIKS